MTTPVAFFIFNRPGFTSLAFEAIRRARPTVLFIIADGPRANQPSDLDLVQQTREVVAKVDWPCEVSRYYAQDNLGCGERLSSGLTKVFDQVTKAIILEDDCLPHPSFFNYCHELLHYYEDDRRIMAISGDNFQSGVLRGSGSYYFSKYQHCWGWATWARAWSYYDRSIADWPEVKQRGLLRGVCGSGRELQYWEDVFENVYAGRIDTWDFSWTYAVWMQNGLSVLPNTNLVFNLGFGGDATHTHQSSAAINPDASAYSATCHPSRMIADHDADKLTDQLFYSGTLPIDRLRLLRQVKRFLANRSIAGSQDPNGNTMML